YTSAWPPDRTGPGLAPARSPDQLLQCRGLHSERSRLEPGWGDHCPPGQRKWTEYGTGKVFCEVDISGTGKGGIGFTQVNVVHVDPIIPLPWLMTLDRQFFGGTWTRYVQHVVQPNAPGLPPVESSAVRVFGPAQIGGL
ncbi:MAG TPA: hypothetical protein VFM39_01300, partial [bacterium]|nr:hypothetical protein [bacterium]